MQYSQTTFLLHVTWVSIIAPCFHWEQLWMLSLVFIAYHKLLLPYQSKPVPFCSLTKILNFRSASSLFPALSMLILSSTLLMTYLWLSYVFSSSLFFLWLHERCWELLHPKVISIFAELLQHLQSLQSILKHDVATPIVKCFLIC